MAVPRRDQNGQGFPDFLTFSRSSFVFTARALARASSKVGDDSLINGW